MKTIFKVIPILFAITAFSCGNKTKTNDATGETSAGAKSEQQAPKEKRLPFERGSYVQESNAMGMNIKQTIYFDKWGDWTATENKSEMEIMKGHTLITDELKIVKGSTHWDLDLAKKTGKTYEHYVPVSSMAAMMSPSAKQLAEGAEVKDLGEENYLGYNCKKVHVKYPQMEMDATILSYGNLTMKMDGKMGKMDVSSKVSAIDLSAPPVSIFEVPSDIVMDTVKTSF